MTERYKMSRNRPQDRFLAGIEELGGERMQVPEGGILYEAGNPADALYVVTEGVMVTKTEEDVNGNLMPFFDTVARPIRLLGIEAVDHGIYDSTAVAIDPSEVLKIGQPLVSAALAVDPELAFRILARQVNEQQQQSAVITGERPARRIIRARRDIYGGNADDQRGRLVAARAGYSREHMNRVLNRSPRRA